MVKQVHTAANEIFNSMRWEGLRWSKVFIQFYKSQQTLSKAEKRITQTQRYKLVFLIKLM